MKHIVGMDEPRQYINKILELQNTWKHRLMGQLYLGKELIRQIEDLIKTLSSIVGQGYKKTDKEWFAGQEGYQGYASKRHECLQALKIYNFSSWEFVQTQSMGKRADNIGEFDKYYANTSTRHECNRKTKSSKQRLLVLGIWANKVRKKWVNAQVFTHFVINCFRGTTFGEKTKIMFNL